VAFRETELKSLGSLCFPHAEREDYTLRFAPRTAFRWTFSFAVQPACGGSRSVVMEACVTLYGNQRASHARQEFLFSMHGKM